MTRTSSFSPDEFNSMIKQFDESLQRSTRIAQDAQQLNEMQSEEIQKFRENLDETAEHLENVEKQIDEIHRGFCCQLCCSAKSRRKKSGGSKKKFSSNRRENEFFVEENSIYTADQLKKLDENLQKLEHFNRLIDEEIRDQIKTLNFLEKHVDVENDRLKKLNETIVQK